MDERVNLFIGVFVLTVLLLISSIFLLIRIKRYGKKPLIISSVAFLIALIVVIPLGNRPLTDDYRGEASVYPYDRYLNEDVSVGTVVKVKGQVLSLDKSTVEDGEVFLLDGDEGSFYIKNNNVDDTEIKDGEIITVYGGYAGNGDNDSPSINAQVIEK